MAGNQPADPSPTPDVSPAKAGLNEVQLAKAVVLDPRENVVRKLEALRLLRSADERSDEIVREMVHAFYATPDHELRTDILRQLHGVKTPELRRPLLEVLSDPGAPRKLKEEAAETLDGYLDDPTVVAWLEHAAQHEEDEKVRQQAAQSLKLR